MATDGERPSNWTIPGWKRHFFPIWLILADMSDSLGWIDGRGIRASVPTRGRQGEHRGPHEQHQKSFLGERMRCDPAKGGKEENK